MKKLSISHLDNNRLWIPLLLIGIIGYIFFVYSSTESFSLLESSADGVLYQHYFFNINEYTWINSLFSSPTGMIIFLILQLCLWFGLFYDKRISHNINKVKILVIFLICFIISTVYIHSLSSFWIGQLLILAAIYLITKNYTHSTFSMLGISLFIGVAGLFYLGCYLFIFIIIFYALEERNFLKNILIGLFGSLIPIYLVISYMWIMHDEILSLPNIFNSWNWHMNIFMFEPIMIVLFSVIGIGFIYSIVRHLTFSYAFSRTSKFLICYYFISLILFFTESNPQIAINIMTIIISTLLIVNNRIKYK